MEYHQPGKRGPFINRLFFILLVLFLNTNCRSITIIILPEHAGYRIMERDGSVLCRTTPCRAVISRETCLGPDSSLGYTVLAAEKDGIKKTAAFRTCDFSNNQKISLENFGDTGQ